jgi:hypothetical protein
MFVPGLPGNDPPHHCCGDGGRPLPTGRRPPPRPGTDLATIGQMSGAAPATNSLDRERARLNRISLDVPARLTCIETSKPPRPAYCDCLARQPPCHLILKRGEIKSLTESPGSFTLRGRQRRESWGVAGMTS